MWEGVEGRGLEGVVEGRVWREWKGGCEGGRSLGWRGCG